VFPVRSRNSGQKTGTRHGLGLRLGLGLEEIFLRQAPRLELFFSLFLLARFCIPAQALRDVYERLKRFAGKCDIGLLE
jgi:hypothetical protein